MTMRKAASAIFVILIMLTSLTACVKPRPLTFQEQEAYMAKQQCAQEATSMNPDFPGPDNPWWSSYFVMCMNQLGISDAALRRMWW